MPLFDNPRPLGAGAIAFVFQGGGSLTAPQVGTLWALTEAGVAPDLVVGSSAGALNAVAFASDPSPDGLDHLEAVWVSLRRRRVAPFSLRALLAAPAGRGDAFVSDTASQVLLERAALARTLRETCVVGGRLLVDGGVSADVPVLQAEALGANVTYVLPAATWDVTQPLPHRPLPQAYHALRQLLDAAARRDVAAAQRQVHVLPAPTTRIVNPIDFRDMAQLIDKGYRLAAEWFAINATQTHAPATGRPVTRPLDDARRRRRPRS